MTTVTDTGKQLLHMPDEKPDHRPSRTSLAAPIDASSIIFINHMTIESPPEMALSRKSRQWQPPRRPMAMIQQQTHTRSPKPSARINAGHTTNRRRQGPSDCVRAPEQTGDESTLAEGGRGPDGISLKHHDPRGRTGVRFTPSTKSAAPSPRHTPNNNFGEQLPTAQISNPLSASRETTRLSERSRMLVSEKRKNETVSSHKHPKNGRKSESTQAEVVHAKPLPPQPSRPQKHQRQKSYEKKRSHTNSAEAQPQRMPRKRQQPQQLAPPARPSASPGHFQYKGPAKLYPSWRSTHRQTNWHLPPMQQSYRPSRPLPKIWPLRNERECFVLAPTALEQSRRLPSSYPSPGTGGGVAKHGK